MGAQQCRQPVRRSYRQVAVWGQCSAVLLRPAYHRASAVDPMGALWQAAVVVGQSSRWWTSAWPHRMRHVKASGRREVPELLRIGTRSRQTPTRRTRKQARRIRTRTDSSQRGSLLPSNHFADLLQKGRCALVQLATKLVQWTSASPSASRPRSHEQVPSGMVFSG